MGSRRDTAEVGSAYVLHTRNRWPWRSDEGALGQGQPLVRAREDLEKVLVPRLRRLDVA